MHRVISVFSFLVLSGAAAAVSAQDLAKGKEVFERICAACHGPQGQGDGPAAAALPPAMKPRDLQTEDLKVATDPAKMKELIKKGGPAFGLNPLMAAQPSLSEEELDAVVAFVTSLRKK